MSNKCNEINHTNQLRVFISSAMNDENGFAWKELRGKIKSRLNECPFLNAFIIEDYSSVIPSSQYYKYKVEESDLVILLIKGTVRAGTLQEFDIVKNSKKRLIAYFLESDSTDLSVLEVKNEIISSDYCTFHILRDEDNVENIVFIHVMNGLIDWFRHIKLSNENMQDYSLTNISQLNNTVPKYILEKFSSCYGETFNILNIPIPPTQNRNKSLSELHAIGKDMILWLLNNYAFPQGEKIVNLIFSMKTLYPDTLWLSKRWDACKCMANKNYSQALRFESEALDLATQQDLPLWIINDILIDCRNISSRIQPYNPQYQEQLSSSKEFLFFPGLDRCYSNLFNDAIDDYQKELTLSRYESRFGSNLKAIVNNFENSLFISMLYGSYTHIVLAREALAKILYQYGIIYKRADLIYNAVRLFMLCGNANKVEHIIDHEWDKINTCLINYADDLLTLSLKLSAMPSISFMIIKKLMMYFSDDSIRIAADFMLTQSNQIDHNNVDLYIKAVYYACDAMQSEKVVKILTNLLKRKIIYNYFIFTAIIETLNISTVNTKVLIEFCEELKTNAHSIVKNNGNPQYIAVLINQNKEIFKSLKNIPNNGLDDVEMLFFKTNMGENNHWSEILQNQIHEIANQLEANRNSGVHIDFASTPFATIKNAIIFNHLNVVEVKSIIDDELIPLCIQIFTHDMDVNLIEKCIDCLIIIVVQYTKAELEIPSKLITSLSSLNNVNAHNNFPITISTINTVRYKFLMLKVICQIDVKEELYYNYLEFNNKNDTERIALSECLKEYFTINKTSDAILVALAFLMSNDNSFEVRVNACHCLYCLSSNTEHSNLAYLKLRELSTDNSPEVRNTLLTIYKNNTNAKTDIMFKDILLNMHNDAHFVIRKRISGLLNI